MNGAEVLDVARDGVFTLLKITTPLMLAGLVVGLLISLFQALTQIQEMTLAFIPKIIAIFVTLLFMLPFIGQTMASHMSRIAAKIAGG
jgi:flagellar biosynthetic protein FliQ